MLRKLVLLFVVTAKLVSGQTCAGPAPTGSACVAACGGVDPSVLCICVDPTFPVVCSCSEGFINDANGLCKALSTCAEGNPNSCSLAIAGSTCTDLSGGGFTCTCPTGNVPVQTSANTQLCVASSSLTSCYPYPQGGSTSTCQSLGDTAAVCIQGPTDYTCNCSSGFTAQSKSCSDIDECSTAGGTSQCTSLGDSAATCINNIGSYTCNCSSGYIALAGNGTTKCYPNSAFTQTLLQKKKNVIGQIFSGIFSFIGLILLSPLLIIGSIVLLPVMLIYAKLQAISGITLIQGREKPTNVPELFKNELASKVLKFLSSYGSTNVEKYE